MSNISFKNYPYFAGSASDDVNEQVRQICNIRKDDISQISNLSNIFLSGRLVGKIPANSSDVAADDRIGDVSRDNTHTYVLQNQASPQWIRYTGSTF